MATKNAQAAAGALDLEEELLADRFPEERPEELRVHEHLVFELQLPARRRVRRPPAGRQRAKRNTGP